MIDKLIHKTILEQISHPIDFYEVRKKLNEHNVAIILVKDDGGKERFDIYIIDYNYPNGLHIDNSLASISNTKQASFQFMYDIYEIFSKHNVSEQDKVSIQALILQFAFTPIEDRFPKKDKKEDGTLYYVMLDNDVLNENLIYLNKTPSSYHFDYNGESYNYQTKFTQKEIDNLPTSLQWWLEDCVLKQVKVEDIDNLKKGD